MRKMTSFILIIAALCVSCTKEYEMSTFVIDQERDYLPKPTRTEVPSDNEGLMVLGPQLANPYTVAVMQQARAQLLSEDSSLEIPEISVSHFYVRFQPANEEELNLLLQDTTIHFYDFPLDREVISGTYYHDPAIVDSLPTYQYASIPKQKWLPMALSSDTPSYEVLAQLFIPEEVEGLGNDDNDNGGGTIIVPPNPGWGGGIIKPVDPVDPEDPEDPWIPAPDPGEDGEIDPNSINTTSSDDELSIAAMLVNRSMIITGLETEEDQEQMDQMSSDGYFPSGRITAYDDIVNGPVPIVGAKVYVRRWFTTCSAITDATGLFSCNRMFCRPVNYCIKWERAYWDIRDGWLGQAYYNGPKQRGNWDLYINSGKSLGYATVHRAAHRFFYRNNILTKPASILKEKIAYQHRDGNVSGRYWLELGANVLPDIQVFGFNGDDMRSTTSIFSTTIHELGHAAHWSNSTFNFIDAGVTGDLSFIESWAECVEYVLTTLEYEELGLKDSLHIPRIIVHNEETINGYDPNYLNKQNWFLPNEDSDSQNTIYTSIFIDLVDDFNQKNYFYNPPQDLSLGIINRLPTDTLNYSISLIEDIVFSSASFNGVKNHLTARCNPLIEDAEAKQASIISFFYQYQH